MAKAASSRLHYHLNMFDYSDDEGITQMKDKDPLTERIIGCCFILKYLLIRVIYV